MRLGRRAFLLGGGVAAVGGMTPPAAWAYATRIESRRVVVEQRRVAVPGLPPELTGLRIAQISDLHYGDIVSADLIRHAIDVTMKQSPDLIVVTGDFVSSLNHGEADLVARDLARLRAPLGQLAILGNHDHWTDAEAVAAAVRRAGLELLRNGSRPIARGGRPLHLVGVDDIWEKKHDLAAALRAVPPNAPVVLLAHEPDFADEAAADPRIALQLSGHSHGGQVRLPFLGPPVTPPYAKKYADGTYRVGRMTLHVNRGIGTIWRALRFNCPPEITVVELTAAR
jgi:uncharacterized protein